MIFPLPVMGFGDNFIADDEQHGACCEAKGPGHYWLGKPDKRRSEETTQWLGQSSHQGNAEGLDSRVVDGQ